MAAYYTVVNYGVNAGSAEPEIFGDVWVEEIDLSSMTRSQAEEALHRYIDEVISQQIVLAFGDEAWQLDPADIGLSVFVGEIVERALAVGRTGNWLERLKFRILRSRERVNIPLIMSVDEGRFRDFVFALMTDIYVAPEDAAFVINPDDTVSVRPSNTGRYLDPEDLGNHIKEVALKRTDRTVVLNVKPMVPALTTEQANAMNIRECIGRFSTNFNPENKPRVHNIREAARAIDGVILGPGETFSFNEIVGPRSAEAGYLEAPVMVDDDLVPGIGGGICQVSSTLYNAVLLANLSIVARSNHSMLPSYIQAGRDAAVAYDYMDFKFRNDGSSHILVKLIVADNSITAKVYGYAPDGYHVSIVASVDEKIPPGTVTVEDPSLAPGDEVVDDEGAWGYVVTVYRVITKDGVELSRERVSKDRYRARPKRILVGVPSL
ncbi:MAG TPA: VanW family protein [Bacillota bacterium]|jgi:vancomycin resistance protein YoaR|nr:VanW family protein [Bacillota bacterium]